MSDANERKSSRTRRRVLRAAARVFRQQGYTSASLREIAESAGKEDLAEAVMDEGVMSARRSAEAAVAALADPGDALAAIEAAFRGHLTYLLEEADFAVATLRMLHQTPEAVRRRHTRKQRQFGQFYARLFERARIEGLIRDEFDLSALRMLLLGALNWSPEWFDEGKLTAEQLVDQLSRMMRHGLMTSAVVPPA
jgi:AcrR family transcriptional regulator